MRLDDGVIWWSTPRATCGLVVADGRVVECAPYLRRWALGRDAAELWTRQARRGADLVWLPSG